MNTIPRIVDVETGDGRQMADWPVNMRVSWYYDYDTGWEAECTVHSAMLHNLPLTRDMLILMAGEVEIDRIEREEAAILASEWRDYVPEAAE